MFRFLKNSLWIKNIILILGLVSLTSLAVYSADYAIKLQQGSTRLYLNKDKILVVIPGIYDQYRVFNNTLSYEYLFGLNDSYINFDNKPYILNRPSPDTITYQGQNYFFAKDISKIEIAPKIADFNYVDSVAIFSNQIEINTLSSQVESSIGQNMNIQYQCNDNIFSHCRNYLSEAHLQAKLADNANIQLEYTYFLAPGTDPKSVSPTPSFNIPKDFKYCDEKGCVAPQTETNPIKDVDQMPVEIYRDKILLDRKILKDLNLNAINYNKLSLPDLPPQFNIGVFEYPKPEKTFLTATPTGHQIVLNIISPSEVDKIVVDYRYSKIKFLAKPCTANPCKLSFTYQIGYD